MNINYTIIGQSITFIIFVLFCMKYVWPLLIAVMEEREKRIAHGLESAERADKDLELAQREAGKKLTKAKEEAALLVEQANKRASQIVEEAKVSAVEESDRIKLAAKAEVERQVAQAREELRGKVAVLAIAGAEKVLGKEVDASAHTAILSKVAADL